MPALPADATPAERRAAAREADRLAQAAERALRLVALARWREEARVLDAALQRARTGQEALAALSAARRSYAAPDGLFYRALADAMTPPLADAASQAAERVAGTVQGRGSQAVLRARRLAEAAARTQAETAAAEICKVSARPVAAVERLVRAELRQPTADPTRIPLAVRPPPPPAGGTGGRFAALPPVDPEGVWAQRLATLEPLLGKKLAAEVISSTRRGLALGVTPETIALSIMRQARSGGKIAAKRAALIARTESHGAARSGEHAGARAAGMQRKRWRTQADDVVRDSHARCRAEGWRALEDRFSNGLAYPGERPSPAEEVINCFLPGTLVRGAFVGGVRSPYAGPVREIVVASGQRLTVTPNHPVLTPHGFVPAGQLHVGDDVVSDRRHVHAVPPATQVDEHYAPPAIEDVFEALRVRSGASARHLRAMDLHGDARCVVGEVHVVWADRALLHDLEPRLAEGVGQFPLVQEYAAHLPLIGHRAGDLRMHSVAAMARGLPRGGALALNGGAVAFDVLPPQPLCVAPASDGNAHAAERAPERPPPDAALDRERLERLSLHVSLRQHLDIRDDEAPRGLRDGFSRPRAGAHGVATTTQRDAALEKQAPEYGEADARALREFVERHPLAVALDKIVQVRDFDYTGHVYDLTTESGLLTANGIVSSNCRCYLEYLAPVGG